MQVIRQFTDTQATDITLVGGKNAALAQLIRDLSAHNIKVPGGFALTVDAYWQHLVHNKLLEWINQLLSQSNAQKIRDVITQAPLPQEIEQQLITAYKQ